MNNFEERLLYIWLSKIPGIGAKRFHSLLNHFGNPKNVWEAKEEELSPFKTYLGNNVLKDLINSRTKKVLDNILKEDNNDNYRIVTLLDSEYPILLKEIFDPPPVLYCKGLPLNNEIFSFSIVGSRRLTNYGGQMSEKFAFELASHGVAVVSGLARGVDTLAHRGALNAKGYTVGVLGCGIDKIYPYENRKLYEQMYNEGTIISEYGPGTEPFSGNFPARNRIISGMTRGVLVIEAGVKSGALITVDFALEQGRDVFAIPSNINSIQGEGTNKLLKDGAKLVTSIEDILDEYGIISEDRIKKEKDVQLDFFETQVYNALQTEELHLEELLNLTNMELNKLNSILTMLEIKGIITQKPGKFFIKNWDA